MPTILVDLNTRKALVPIRNLLLNRKIASGTDANVTWDETIMFLLEEYLKTKEKEGGKA